MTYFDDQCTMAKPGIGHIELPKSEAERSGECFTSGEDSLKMWCTEEILNIGKYTDSKICQAENQKKLEVGYKFGECMSMGGTFVMAKIT